MTGQMRLEQRMALAPRMIQSMEILQLPILALQERIEQELNSNPVLEIEEPSEPAETGRERQDPDENIGEQDLVVDTDNNKARDFERLDRIEDDFKEYMDQAEGFRPRRGMSDEPDAKQQALSNTAAPCQSLHEHLMEQWRLVETDERVEKAGRRIIDYIDERGYLSVRLEQLHNKDRNDFGIQDLRKALSLVQKLEPAGVGARDLRECLLIQIEQSSEDMEFERRLVSEHMEALLENHLPDIAAKMNCGIERINEAIGRLSKFDTSPGLQVGQHRNHPITADVIVEPGEGAGEFTVRLADWDLPALRISTYYDKMSKDATVSEKTRK